MLTHAATASSLRFTNQFYAPEALWKLAGCKRSAAPGTIELINRGALEGRGNNSIAPSGATK
jgi:hypothetical protein